MKFKVLAFLLSLAVSLNSAMAMHSSFEILFHIFDHHSEDAHPNGHHHHGEHAIHSDHEHDEVLDNPAFQFDLEQVAEDREQQESNTQHSHALPSTTSSFSLLPLPVSMSAPVSEPSNSNILEYKSATISSPYLSSIFRPPRT